jgi:iron complex transport system ATP-binding protein
VTPSVELSGLQVDVSGRRVLDGVSLRLMPGEVLGVVGANGSGKTTLLRAALGLAAARGGWARLGGEEVSRIGDLRRAALAGYLPQDRSVGWNMPAWRIAALGAVNHPPAEARRRALEALDETGVGAMAERGVLDMSGGERARVLFARLLATGAPLLVADEPASGLDPHAQLLIMDLLRARAAKDVAVMVSVHDLTLAARTCDRVAVLAAGRLIAVGPAPEALAPAVLQAAFQLDGRFIDSEAGPVLAAARATPVSTEPPKRG